MSNEIRDKLNYLAAERAKREEIWLSFDRRISILLAPLAEEIEAIKQDRALAVMNYDLDIEMLEADIKESTVEYGESIKGTFLRAQYTRGRVSWNTKGLVGYSVANPDVLAFRKQGKSYVSIRGI